MIKLPDFELSIEDDLIFLKRLKESEVTESYVNWLNDPEINTYLECRHTFHTLESTKEYISNLSREDSNELMFGIFLSANKQHIGNIKLGPIDWVNSHAIVGLLIGESDFWGRGIGTRAIGLLSSFSVRSLELTTLMAGCYSENLGSYKAFLKAGWSPSGCIPNYWTNSSGKRSDELLISYNSKPFIDIPAQGGTTLIGGGSLLNEAASFLRAKSEDVLVVVASRHAHDSYIQNLQGIGCNVYITDEPNLDVHLHNELISYSRLCLCFGPAWIFKEKILNIFQDRIFNFNGIPIPRYLGGAHFSWQILHENREGGAFIQQITDKIDRGDIILFEKYNLPASLRTPLQYEEYNNKKGFDIVKRFLSKALHENPTFTKSTEFIDWQNLLYYPRLYTPKNAWINWNWSGRDIERFCNAFDSPYPGARTISNNLVAILKDVKFHEDQYSHPYSAGLIVRLSILPDHLWVAVTDGFLEVKCFSLHYDENNPQESIKVKLGDRLQTPLKYLDDSLERVNFDSKGLK